MLRSSTHPTLKLRSDQPQAPCSLDRYPSLLLHHGKTVAIRPGKQGSAVSKRVDA